MEDYELALKLIGYPVWEEHTCIVLNEKGEPILCVDYKPDKNAITIHKEWEYKNNKWREI